MALLETATRDAAKIAGVAESTAWRYRIARRARKSTKRTDGMITQAAGPLAEMAESRATLPEVMRTAPPATPPGVCAAVLDAGAPLELGATDL